MEQLLILPFPFCWVVYTKTLRSSASKLRPFRDKPVKLLIFSIFTWLLKSYGRWLGIWTDNYCLKSLLLNIAIIITPLSAFQHKSYWTKSTALSSYVHQEEGAYRFRPCHPYEKQCNPFQQIMIEDYQLIQRKCILYKYYNLRFDNIKFRRKVNTVSIWYDNSRTAE